MDATQMPAAISAGYVEDLRYLFLRRWEHELEQIGISLAPTYPQRLNRSQARLLDHAPFADPYGNLHGADFCFGYGADSYSFHSLNYRNPYLCIGQPRHFLHRDHPLVLGNFAVRVEKPASSMWIFPPPDVQVAGVAEVATAKHSSVVMWLGVRYAAESVDQWLLDDLEIFDLAEPLLPNPVPTYAYGTVFSQQYAGVKYDLTPDEERELRVRMGYPAKGKPIREQMLYEAVCGIFGQGNVIRRYRNRELEGLEIDVWVPSMRLGIEYQGQQHFRRVAHWQGVDGLEKQKQRDAKKRNLCKALGIRLVYFGPGDDLDRASVVSMLRCCRIL